MFNTTKNFVSRKTLIEFMIKSDGDVYVEDNIDDDDNDGDDDNDDDGDDDNDDGGGDDDNDDDDSDGSDHVVKVEMTVERLNKNFASKHGN